MRLEHARRRAGSDMSVPQRNIENAEEEEERCQPHEGDLQERRPTYPGGERCVCRAADPMGCAQVRRLKRQPTILEVSPASRLDQNWSGLEAARILSLCVGDECWGDE